MRYTLISAVAVLLACSVVASPAEAAACKKGQVYVKAKTPLRRGPGLNYPVSSLIETRRCWKLQEMSADQNWMMVEGPGDAIGWVPANALDEDERPTLEDTEEPGGTKRKTGPIGSGQQRGYVVAKATSALFSRPDSNAEASRMLPTGSKLLALSITKDGSFVEVRDERGATGWVASRGIIDDDEILPTLPRMEGGLNGPDRPSGSNGANGSNGSNGASGASTGERKDRPVQVVERTESPSEPVVRGSSAPPSEPAARSQRSADPQRTTVVPKDEDPGRIGGGQSSASSLTLEISGLAGLPSQKLDSNGTAAVRRYSLHAFAPGAHLGVKTNALDPLSLRVSYEFLYLAGLTFQDDKSTSVTGQQHDAWAVAGYPIALDSVTVTPEFGYNFGLFSMPAAAPGMRGAQFSSSHSHAGTLGLSVLFAFSDEVSLRLDGAGMLGTSIAYLLDLGSPKLLLGARGGAAFSLLLGGGTSLIAHYALVWRKTDFEGASLTDPSITWAHVTHVENTFGLGVSFGL